MDIGESSICSWALSHELKKIHLRFCQAPNKYYLSTNEPFCKILNAFKSFILNRLRCPNINMRVSFAAKGMFSKE